MLEAKACLQSLLNTVLAPPVVETAPSMPIFFSKHLSISQLAKKYKLDNTDQRCLEQGLRRAALKGDLNDLKLFASVVENIDAQDKNKKRTAYIGLLQNDNIKIATIFLCR
jgi:hypothetical protein